MELWLISREVLFIPKMRMPCSAVTKELPVLSRSAVFYQAHIPTFAAGYWLFGFASKKYHPVDDLDPEAWNTLNLRTRYYTTRLHRGAFYLPAFLEEMLQEVED